MERSKFSEEQVAYALRQADSATMDARLRQFSTCTLK